MRRYSPTGVHNQAAVKKYKLVKTSRMRKDYGSNSNTESDSKKIKKGRSKSTLKKWINHSNVSTKFQETGSMNKNSINRMKIIQQEEKCSKNKHQNNNLSRKEQIAMIDKKDQ